jgi:truncated hemoglobin YjbI
MTVAMTHEGTLARTHFELVGGQAAVERIVEEFYRRIEVSRERGHPRLRMWHRPFRIATAERDAWMLCMTGALEEVVGSNRLREHLLQSMFKIADWMRNDGVAR